ncbi:MAG: PhzF family phenazine biosynthesis protein [Thermoleophilaceae bacterium]
MTTSVPFALVDVFADTPLTGNPLAVVADAERLEEPVMRAVAREFNQSETTFVLPPTMPGATWRLRSFTPAGAEVVGPGHNVLGAWWWLATAGRIELDAEGRAALAQQIGDRVLPVEVSGRNGRPEAVVIEQAPPELGRTVTDRDELAGALGFERGGADLLEDMPAQVVSTGAAHLLVPARDRAVVERARPDAPRLAAVLAHVGGQGCYLYCLDPVDPAAVAHARFFNPTVGIWEDPATGSAAGPLVSRLVAQSVVPDGAPVLVEQGHAIGRPSRIQVQVSGERVRISGPSVVVAEGALTL